MEEVHPLKWYIPPGSTALICGTFPPVQKRWSYNFFYPNKLNFFWPIMAAVGGKPLVHFSGDEAVAERQNILQSLHCGITDMGHTILRTHNNSLDENLAIVQYMDLLQLLEDHPTIHKIIFTSSSGKSSAAGWFRQYLRGKKIAVKFPGGPKPWTAQLEIPGRTVQLHVLLSPSPRAANRFGLDKLVQLYKAALES